MGLANVNGLTESERIYRTEITCDDHEKRISDLEEMYDNHESRISMVEDLKVVVGGMADNMKTMTDNVNKLSSIISSVKDTQLELEKSQIEIKTRQEYALTDSLKGLAKSINWKWVFGVVSGGIAALLAYIKL